MSSPPNEAYAVLEISEGDQFHNDRVLFQVTHQEAEDSHSLCRVLVKLVNLKSSPAGCDQ